MLIVLVVGLTGGIGSGKSTVAELLERHGAVVVDADRITRDLQKPGTAVFEAMVERFGPAIVATDGTLDRAAVAEVVFSDPAALADLNRIVHPEVGKEIARRLAELEGTDEIVVLDVPLMVETARGGFAGLLVVDVDPEIAVRRLVDGRGFSEDDARRRIAVQASRQERLGLADHVIENSGTVAELQTKVEAAWAWIETLRDARG